MIPRLDEFTIEQLQDLLTEVVYVIRKHEHGGFADLLTINKYENLCLWRTQLLNAISIVQMNQRTVNN